MLELIRQFIDWVAQHPHWAGSLIALVAFSESLAFVGLVVPGAMIMFAAGALIAGGIMDFWVVYAWALVGAVLGDGVSYWFGRHYRDRIQTFWPFSRHPELLARGQTLFQQHGGKSILIGRFIGPVRPVIPVVAGMLGMRPFRFYATNVISALGWAPAYLLPGMAFGASLVLAGAVAERLVMLVGMLAIAAWFIIVLIRRLYQYASTRAGHWAAQTTRWLRKHKRFAWLFGDLLDPNRPPSRALALWLVLLIGGAWLFLGIVEDVVTLDPLVHADQAVYHLLQGVRGPLGDHLMVVLSELGDMPVVATVTVFVALWLVWRRAWPDLGYWIAAVTFGTLLVAAFKAGLHIHRPVELYSGLSSYSFPSGHATMSMVVYGFAAVLSASELVPRWRPVPYTVVALLVTGIAVSRLYLGAHWLSDVAGGLALGLAWVALLALARERHPRRRLGLALAPSIAAVLVLVGTWHVAMRLKEDLHRYAVREPTQVMASEAWWTQGWQRLPVYRLDLEGEYEQPLNIQWAGDLKAIRKQLTALGWQDPIPLNWRTAMQYLAPSPKVSNVPLLPQLHDGRYESLLMVNTESAHKGKLLVLHLWRTEFRLKAQQTPVWIGTLDWLGIKRLPLFSFPVTFDHYDAALSAALPKLSKQCLLRSHSMQEMHRAEKKENGSAQLLLCRTSEADHLPAH